MYVRNYLEWKKDATWIFCGNSLTWQQSPFWPPFQSTYFLIRTSRASRNILKVRISRISRESLLLMSYPDVFLYCSIGISAKILSPHFLEQGFEKDLTEDISIPKKLWMRHCYASKNLILRTNQNVTKKHFVFDNIW